MRFQKVSEKTWEIFKIKNYSKVYSKQKTEKPGELQFPKKKKKNRQKKLTHILYRISARRTSVRI